MAIFREVWTFTGSDGSRWSETLHTTATTLASAANFGQNYLNLRLNLLSEYNRLRSIRVSKVGGNRESVLVPVNQPGLVSGFAANCGEVAMLGMGSPAVGSSRKYQMRGFEESAIARHDQGAVHHITPETLQKLGAWFDGITGNDYRAIVLATNKEGTDGVIKRRIISVNGTTDDGIAVVTCDNPLGVVAGDLVQFYQLSPKILPGAAGRFEVLSVNGNAVNVQYRTPARQNYPLTVGYAKKISFNENARISRGACAFLYMSSKKTRNNIINTLGARPALRLRNL